MYVCICAAVTDSQIEQAAQCGCDSIESLGAELGVGTVCGCCRQTATDLLARVSNGFSSIAEVRRPALAA